jgi:hypothetical protein
VVGDVDEPGQLGQAGAQQRLDALPERDLGQAAALAAALEADPDPAAGDAGHADPAAVGGDRRVDVGVEDALGRATEIAGLRRRRVGRG